MEAFFLPAASGQRFCLYHAPAGGLPGRGAVVFVHPFAEEMNKSRRMAALQSRALAAAGFAVLQVDLLGCGDSSGHFGEAGWADWVADVLGATAWLRQRTDAPLWLWGLRAGCLVAAAAAPQLKAPVNMLFWQPAVSGKLFLRHFLRLRMAGGWLDGEAGSTHALRERLAVGEAVEVAGYLLSPALASGLEAAELTPTGLPARVAWLELDAPASEKSVGAWRSAGHRLAYRRVAGPQFWQTVDATECPALIDATLELLQEEAGP